MKNNVFYKLSHILRPGLKLGLRHDKSKVPNHIAKENDAHFYPSSLSVLSLSCLSLSILSLKDVSLILVLLLFPYATGFTQEAAIKNMSLSFIEDPNNQLTKETALSQFNNHQATSVPVLPTKSMTFNQGSRDSHYWLLFNFTNHASQPLQAKLLTGAAYRVRLKAYLYKHGAKPDQGTLILDENEQKPFSSRISRYRYLNSEPFRLSPGENASILIQYQSRGATFLPLSVASEKDFSETITSDLVFGAIFYSFGLTLGLMFLLLNIAMKNHGGIYYAGLFLLGLLFIAAIDGYAFKFLWPEWPRWNQYSSLIILLGINAFGFFSASRVSNLKNFGVLFNNSSLVLAVINSLLMLLVTQLNFSLLAGIANLFLFIMFVFQFIAIRSWVALTTGTRNKTRNKITSLGVLALALVMGVLVALFFVSEKLPAELIYYSNYIIYLFVSSVIMTIISAHMIGLRKDHETALQEQLASAKREAEINKSLFETEQKYSQIREIARLRQQKLASASHDIRQPLTSLRSTMDSLSRQQKPQIREQLHNAFDYMEQLCNSYLQETRPENDPLQSLQTTADNEYQEPASTDSQEKEQPYSVSLILNTTKRMFENEAIEKGLKFKVVDSSIMIQEPPLVLIRIVSNLVSNAVKHTDKGKILIGCRRHNGKLRIEAHDTGQGLAQNAIIKMQQPYQKGKESKGEGLGLAISHEMAKQHHMEIIINSVPGKGSCFAVEVGFL